MDVLQLALNFAATCGSFGHPCACLPTQVPIPKLVLTWPFGHGRTRHKATRNSFVHSYHVRTEMTVEDMGMRLPKNHKFSLNQLLERYLIAIRQ